MPIHLLPDQVASQIAAGEVVERPASVIKELLENALDAGARSILVRIEEAGKQLMEVADDGQGIAPEELLLAVSRHATSKLTSAEDLFHLRTLGFRGEALASIGSVSRLTLTSRAAGADAGARLRVDGGLAGGVESIGAPVGTSVLVEDLFFNVPARLKFLKTDATERQQITTLVMRYAAAYPAVRFRLTVEGRQALQTSGSGDRREVLAALYGIDLARQMLEVTWEEDQLRLSGYISPISITRVNRREITWFINGRWVADTPLTSALTQAYHTLLMVGRYPVSLLFLELPPELVDVNVHPAKAEVRFRSPDLIFALVQRAVRRALLAYSPVPGFGPVPETCWSGVDWSPVGGVDVDPAFQGSANLPAWEQEERLGAEAGEEAPAMPPSPPSQPALPNGGVPLLRLVGQIGATYLVAEGPDGLYLIDQHAAHERVLFERLTAGPPGSLPAQALLAPVSVQLGPAQAQVLAEQLPWLARYGFQVEPFGPNTFLIRALPALFAQSARGASDPAAALRALVEDFEEDETPLQAELEARLIARVCKRMAVKAGQVLNPEEQHALLQDLEACQSPRTCPHGRPTMIHLSVDTLERQFGRRGAR